MAAYRRVYDSRHLQADCQEPGSAPLDADGSWIEHTAIFCLCRAVVFLYLTSYAYVHLTLYIDVFPMIQMLNLFLAITLSMVVAIPVLVKM